MVSLYKNGALSHQKIYGRYKMNILETMRMGLDDGHGKHYNIFQTLKQPNPFTEYINHMPLCHLEQVLDLHHGDHVCQSSHDSMYFL